MTQEYTLKINENRSIQDGNDNNVNWISGHINFPETSKLPTPDIFKILSFNEDFTDVKTGEISLDFDTDLSMLPDKFDAGLFFGADYISGHLFYGKRAVIEAVDKELEDYILQDTPDNKYLSQENPTTVAIWHLDNGESLLMLHYDAAVDYDIPNEISAKEVLNIQFGAAVDDLTVDYMLSTIVYPILEEGEISGDEDASTYISYNNEDYSIDQKDLFINLTKVLFCDFMHWDEMEDKDEDEDDEDQGVDFYSGIAKTLATYN